jgi:hydrogenase maturation protein HypF
MELEGRAAAFGIVPPLSGSWSIERGVLDFSPMLSALLDCEDASYGAALFHATLAAGLAEWVLAAVDRQKGAKIAVGGGCAMNAVLMSALRGHLEMAGAILLEACQAPPIDGGLALGQAWVARRMFEEI